MRTFSGAVLGCAAAAVSFSAPASADAFRTTPLLKTGAPVSIQGYAQQNPACREWTNGCVLCTAVDGHSQCSTPGIACQPAGITCKRMSK